MSLQNIGQKIRANCLTLVFVYRQNIETTPSDAIASPPYDRTKTPDKYPPTVIPIPLAIIRASPIRLWLLIHSDDKWEGDYKNILKPTEKNTMKVRGGLSCLEFQCVETDPQIFF